jgi:hypothetical protein
LGIVKQATQIDGKGKEANNNNHSKIISSSSATTTNSTLDAFMT